MNHAHLCKVHVLESQSFKSLLFKSSLGFFCVLVFCMSFFFVSFTCATVFALRAICVRVIKSVSEQSSNNHLCDMHACQSLSSKSHLHTPCLYAAFTYIKVLLVQVSVSLFLRNNFLSRAPDTCGSHETKHQPHKRAKATAKINAQLTEAEEHWHPHGFLAGNQKLDEH